MNIAPMQRSRFVKGPMLESMNGYTADARNKKRKNGVWLEGIHWVKAPDGNILYDWQKIDDWAVNDTKLAAGQN